VKDGWDAANALEDGWTSEGVAELIRQVVPAERDLERLKGEPATATDKSTQNEANFASCASFARPVMDDAAYHGIMGDAVRAILPHSEADPVALLMQGLVMGGNVIGLTENETAIQSAGAVVMYRKPNKPALGPPGDCLDDGPTA
jgi:hypothetical protein